MPMDPAAMAGGTAPQPEPQTQITPGQTSTANPQAILQALEAVVQQAIDGQGYVDMNKLILLWPQIAQQMGINVPFQTVMQLIQQNPDLIADMISKFGLAGIISNGQKLSAQQLLTMGTGAG